MVDPVTVGTAIGWSINTAAGVWKMVSFVRDVANAPKHAMELCDEIATIRIILCRLQPLAENESQDLSSFVNDIFVDDVTTIILSLVGNLSKADKLLKNMGLLKKPNVLDRMTWVARADEVSSTVTVLQNNKLSLIAFLSVVDRYVACTRKRMALLTSLLVRQTQQRLSERQEKLIQDLHFCIRTLKEDNTGLDACAYVDSDNSDRNEREQDEIDTIREFSMGKPTSVPLNSCPQDSLPKVSAAKSSSKDRLTATTIAQWDRSSRGRPEYWDVLQQTRIYRRANYAHSISSRTTASTRHMTWFAAF